MVRPTAGYYVVTPRSAGFWFLTFITMTKTQWNNRRQAITSNLLRNVAVKAGVATIILSASSAMAQTNISDIIDGTETVFLSVAALCVTIAIFFVGLRMAKRVK